MSRSDARDSRRPQQSRRTRNLSGFAISERLASVVWGFEGWWCRHVSQRALHRALDRVPGPTPMETTEATRAWLGDPRGHVAERLAKLRADEPDSP